MPSAHPPYIFRLAIQLDHEALSEAPTVTVRQPRTALSLVKKHTLELHLQLLTDVELEVSHGGQTLNRLLLKSELQTARSRAEAMLAWNRFLAAKSNQLPQAQLAALLETAHQAHHTWAQFDPMAARQALAHITQERQRFQTAPAPPTHPGSVGPAALHGPLSGGQTPSAEPLARSSMGATIEPELQAIREEMFRLVARVAPWGDDAWPAWPPTRRTHGGQLALVLAGLCLMGMAVLLISYRTQRRLSAQAVRRRRLLSTLEGQTSLALAPRQPKLAPGRQPQMFTGQPAVRRLTTLSRRWRVVQRTTRRIRIQALPRSMQSSASLPRGLRPRALTPEALIAALEQLRDGLLSRQSLASGPNPSADHEHDPAPSRR